MLPTNMVTSNYIPLNLNFFMWVTSILRHLKTLVQLQLELTQLLRLEYFKKGVSLMPHECSEMLEGVFTDVGKSQV